MSDNHSKGSYFLEEEPYFIENDKRQLEALAPFELKHVDDSCLKWKDRSVLYTLEHKDYRLRMDHYFERDKFNGYDTVAMLWEGKDCIGTFEGPLREVISKVRISLKHLEA
jgi:hypothetical protein